MFESEVIHQEGFLLQQVGFELAALAPSKWLEICRLRSALQAGNGPRSAVTGVVSHLANHLAAIHIDCFSFCLAIRARFVSALVCCRPGLIRRL